MTRRFTFLSEGATLLGMKPTFALLTSNDDRKARSECCDSRVQMVLRRGDTTAGAHLVYSCNRCSKLYVLRERDENPEAV